MVKQNTGTVLLLGNSESPVRRIGIYRIATALRRHGVTVHVIDYASFFNPDEIYRFAQELRPDWIGISVQWAKDYTGTRSLQAETNVDENEILLQKLSQLSDVVLGGQNPIYGIKSLPHGIVKYAVSGFADNAVLELHDHILGEKNITPMFEIINGTKVLHANQLFPVTDLSTLGIDFQPDDFIADEKISLEISRGCIFKCTFCNYQLKGKKPGTYIRSKEDIQAEIVKYHTEYGTTKFVFCDDTFNDCIEKLELIRDIRNDTGIPFEFWAYGRADLLMSNPEMEELSKQIGWKVIFFGIESFNKESGKSVRKGADPSKIKEFLVRYSKDAPDTDIHLGLIIGLPHDTPDTLKDSYWWLRDNSNIFSRIRPATMRISDPAMNVFPTEIDLNPEKYGYKITDELHHNRFLKWETEHLTFDEAFKWQNEFKRLNRNRSSWWGYDDAASKQTIDNYITNKTNYLNNFTKKD